MSSASFRLETFRPWNPFQDKPQSLRKSAGFCRYPSPVSITVTPPPSVPRDDVSKNLQGHLDQAQRHPLPARPPVEVCLNDGSRSDTQSILSEAEELQSDLQSTRSEAEDSQRTVPLQQLPPSFCPGDPVQTQEIPATMHIDPAILYDDPSRNAEHGPKVATDLNATLSDIWSSPEPPIISTDLTPRSTQHNAEDTVTSNRQTPRVTKRPYTRKGGTGKGPNRLLNTGVSSRKNFSFSLLRSHFLAMPAEERLQFLSWLFEGSLQHCVSPPSTNACNAAALNGTTYSNEDMAHDCAYQNSNDQPAKTQALPLQYASTLELAHEKWPSEEEGCRPADDDQLEYEVEKILRHREDAHGSISYLVKWKGYEELEATWEPYGALHDTTALENYELRLAVTAKSAFGTSFASTRSSDPAAGTAYPGKNTRLATGRTRKGQSWTMEETRLLKKLRVEEQLPWLDVYRRFIQEFPGRTQGSIQVYWYTTAKNLLPQL